MLHHLFRGTGLAGLQGMPATRPLARGIMLARPLIGFYRSQLLAFLESIGADFAPTRATSTKLARGAAFATKHCPSWSAFSGRKSSRRSGKRPSGSGMSRRPSRSSAELLEKSLEDQSPDSGAIERGS